MSVSATRPVTEAALDLHTVPLGILATEIEAAHEAVLRAGADLIDHAIRAGALLIEAKALAGHGCWETWLAAHCPQSARRAQRYMRFARHQSKIDQIRHAAAGLTLDAVEKGLSLRQLDDALAGPSRGTKGDDRIHDEEQPPLIAPFTLGSPTHRLPGAAEHRRVHPARCVKRPAAGHVRRVRDHVAAGRRGAACGQTDRHRGGILPEMTAADPRVSPARVACSPWRDRLTRRLHRDTA